MIFTESQLRYLAELPSAVAHALPDAANPGVPFFVKDPAVLTWIFAEQPLLGRDPEKGPPGPVADSAM
jgi:hypothetical protein